MIPSHLTIITQHKGNYWQNLNNFRIWAWGFQKQQFLVSNAKLRPLEAFVTVHIYNKKKGRQHGGLEEKYWHSILVVLTNLCTNTSCTDNRKEGVSLWPHCHIDTREQLGEFLLILLCWANCVHINLSKTDGRRKTKTKQMEKSKGGWDKKGKWKSRHQMLRFFFKNDKWLFYPNKPKFCSLRKNNTKMTESNIYVYLNLMDIKGNPQNASPFLKHVKTNTYIGV